MHGCMEEDLVVLREASYTKYALKPPRPAPPPKPKKVGRISPLTNFHLPYRPSVQYIVSSDWVGTLGWGWGGVASAFFYWFFFSVCLRSSLLLLRDLFYCKIVENFDFFAENEEAIVK